MNTSLINSTSNPADEQLLQISLWIFILVQVVNFIMGIPLNVYVIVRLTRAGGLDESVCFAISQSASEILYALSAPLYILYAICICLTTPLQFFTGIGMISRLMFQCLVCLECYAAVVQPITFLKFKPLKYWLFCLIVAWICVLTCSITIMLVPDYRFLDFIGSFYVIIVIVELFCCVSILKVLRQPAPGIREDSGMSNTKKKAFRIVIISLLTHLIQMIPLAVLFTFRNVFSLMTMIGTSSISMAVNIAAGLIPPFFFLYRAGKLRIRRPLAGQKANS